MQKVIPARLDCYGVVSVYSESIGAWVDINNTLTETMRIAHIDFDESDGTGFVIIEYTTPTEKEIDPKVFEFDKWLKERIKETDNDIANPINQMITSNLMDIKEAYQDALSKFERIFGL